MAMWSGQFGRFHDHMRPSMATDSEVSYRRYFVHVPYRTILQVKQARSFREREGRCCVSNLHRSFECRPTEAASIKMTQERSIGGGCLVAGGFSEDGFEEGRTNSRKNSTMQNRKGGCLIWCVPRQRHPGVVRMRLRKLRGRTTI